MLLGKLSIFPCDVNVKAALDKIMADTIKLSVFQPDTDGKFEFLKPVVEEIPDDEFPVTKRARTEVDFTGKVDATAAFVVQVPSSNLDRTALMKFEPEFVKSVAVSKQGLCRGGIVFLKHCQNNWMIVVHGAIDEKVCDLFIRALPHARACHFSLLQWRGHEIQWESVVTCVPPATVVFQPCPIAISCKVGSGEVLCFQGDVTWTVRTVLAFLSVHL